jgi:hypothetical protein
VSTSTLVARPVSARVYCGLRWGQAHLFVQSQNWPRSLMVLKLRGWYGVVGTLFVTCAGWLAMAELTWRALLTRVSMIADCR